MTYMPILGRVCKDSGSLAPPASLPVLAPAPWYHAMALIQVHPTRDVELYLGQ